MILTLSFPVFLSASEENEREEDQIPTSESTPESFSNPMMTPKPVKALIRGEKGDSSVVKYKITATPGHVWVIITASSNYAFCNFICMSSVTSDHSHCPTYTGICFCLILRRKKQEKHSHKSEWGICRLWWVERVRRQKDYTEMTFWTGCSHSRVQYEAIISWRLDKIKNYHWIFLYFPLVALQANRRNQRGSTARRFASSPQLDARCESREPHSDTPCPSRTMISVWRPTVTWSLRRITREVKSRRAGKPARLLTTRRCTSTDRTKRLKTRCLSSLSAMKAFSLRCLLHLHQFVVETKFRCSAFVTVHMAGRKK